MQPEGFILCGRCKTLMLGLGSAQILAYRVLSGHGMVLSPGPWVPTAEAEDQTPGSTVRGWSNGCASSSGTGNKLLDECGWKGRTSCIVRSRDSTRR